MTIRYCATCDVEIVPMTVGWAHRLKLGRLLAMCLKRGIDPVHTPLPSS